MRVRFKPLFVLFLVTFSMFSAVSLAEDHDAQAVTAATPTPMPVIEDADDMNADPFTRIDEHHAGETLRCNSVGTIGEKSDATSEFLEVKIFPHIPVKGLHVEVLPIHIGMEKEAIKRKETEVKASFCVKGKAEDNETLFKPGALGVPVTRTAGFLVCEAKIRIEFEAKDDKFAKFFAVGFQSEQRNIHFWETTQEFEVHIDAGTPQKDMAQYCQKRAEWARMNQEAKENENTAAYIQKEYSPNVQCIYDRECPTPRSTGALGYDLSHVESKRCVYFSNRETGKFSRTQCLNLRKEGVRCYPSSVGMGREQGNCDFGLKCEYSHREWFPDGGGPYVNRYACKKN